mgnify:FL=1
MITNADITYYSCDSAGKYTRYEIRGAHWEETKQANVLKSGLTSIETVKVFIPAENLPSELKFNAGKDIIVKGITDFEFDNTSQQTISNSLKTLKEQNDKVLTVSIVDEKMYGSPWMRHVQLGCK